MEVMTLFDPDRPPLARNTDPDTSRKAAERISRTLTDKHLGLLARFVYHGPMTDDQASDWAVRQNLYTRHEQARRGLRTLRDHHLLTVCLDGDGIVVTAMNQSGRLAQMWRPTLEGERRVRL